MKLKALTVAIAAAMFAAVAMAGAASPANSAEPTAKCTDGNAPTTVTVGIVQMQGCWTERTGDDGVKSYIADLASQPVHGPDSHKIKALDMNGLLISGVKDQDKIVVNTKTDSIRSVNGTGETATDVQLNSYGFPVPNDSFPVGSPIGINFVPPKQGTVVLEDLQLGQSSKYMQSLAGFSPVGGVETPIVLGEGGTGSMDVTISMAGIYSLKGKPQSLTIKIPSKVGEGSRVDGFHLHLQEIDGLKPLKINDLEAEYSAEEKRLGGGADFALPFMGGKGVSFAFEIENTVLTKASVGVSGIKVPIGAPPGGFITAFNGGFGFKQIDDYFVVNLNAGASAEFGPELPTPWGKVVPIEVSAALQAGKEGQDWYFHFDGGIKVFRLPVGDVYLKIHSNSGVDFGFGIGIGFPSYKNSPNDPFYIGAGVKGWVAKQHFQFSGDGRVRLFGLNIFDGRILINDKAAGACWKVLWADGGAVYPYGGQVQTFGVSCGLDRYQEAYPKATRAGEVLASASQSRQLKTGKRTVIMSVRGQDGAPRFKLTSKDGRSFAVPKSKDAVKTKTYMIVADEQHNVTHVFTPRLRNGNWTITPYADSTPIMGLKTGQELPPEKVRAQVLGKGLHRTLVWNSKGNPHTKLAFTEVMKGGYEQPILTTDKVRGRYQFSATNGSHYGKRKLRAYVIHGGTPREVTIEDLYTVHKPGKLRAPRVVRAWRNIYTATATWQGVPGASGYVAEIAIRNAKGKKVTSYRRHVGPKRRKIVIPRYPGGNWAVASVQALNADGVPGRIRSKRFRLAPPKKLSLKQASRRSANSAHRVGGQVKVRTLCPLNGHCQTRVLLKHNGKTVGQKSFQQVPGTYRFVMVKPDTARLRRQLAQGRLRHLRAVVHQHRVTHKVTPTLGSPVDDL